MTMLLNIFYTLALAALLWVIVEPVKTWLRRRRAIRRIKGL